jgi:hypothetical protein
MTLLALAALGLVYAEVDPCPSGKDSQIVRNFSGCEEAVPNCVWYSPNWGKDWQCYFYCCYDSQGHFLEKKIGDCSPAECANNGGCCNSLVSCYQARQNEYDSVRCPAGSPVPK